VQTMQLRASSTRRYRRTRYISIMLYDAYLRTPWDSQGYPYNTIRCTDKLSHLIAASSRVHFDH
jgi:hypothetical protein